MRMLGGSERERETENRVGGRERETGEKYT